MLDPDVVARLVGRKRRASPLDNLTPREREVLSHIAEGRSNAGIASELTVSVAAIERHVPASSTSSGCSSPLRRTAGSRRTQIPQKCRAPARLDGYRDTPGEAARPPHRVNPTSSDGNPQGQAEGRSMGCLRVSGSLFSWWRIRNTSGCPDARASTRSWPGWLTACATRVARHSSYTESQAPGRRPCWDSRPGWPRIFRWSGPRGPSQRGAGLCRAAPAVRADVRSTRRPARTPAGGARDRVRHAGRRATGPFPGRPGGTWPAGRVGGRSPPAVRGRQHALARSGVEAGTGLRGAAAGQQGGLDDLRRARADHGPGRPAHDDAWRAARCGRPRPHSLRGALAP